MRGPFRARVMAMLVGLVIGVVVAPSSASLASPRVGVRPIPGGPATWGVRAGAAWGLNSTGQLGDGSWSNRTLPVDVYRLNNVAKIAAGRIHSLAVMADGTMRTWGANGYGQLGYGIYVNASHPGTVPGLSSVIDAAGGWTHSLAVRSDGTVWAWGDNQFGQIGDGTTVRRFSPVRVAGLTGATAVAAGNGWSMALRSDGSVWLWGSGGYGLLGTDAQQVPSPTPVKVAGLSNVVAIAAGAQHAMAIATDATGGFRSVWTWGQNAVGQLGADLCDGIICGSPVPYRVPNLPGVTAIAAGATTSVALGSDGSVWTWGANFFGALGGGATVPFRYDPMVAVAAGSGIVRVAAGRYHVVAARTNGTVIGWGSNSYGELGNGTTATQSGTVQVGRLTRVSQLAAGEYYTLAIYTRPLVAQP